MKFVTFKRNGASEPGVLIHNDVVSLKGAGFAGMLDVIAGGVAARPRIEAWILKPPASQVASLAAVRLLAPIPRPPKIICVGLNYRDHAMESNMEIPKVPTIFSKYGTAVIGPDEAIRLPRVSTKPDYEAEFAVIIGKGGRYIPGAKWREHVFGYTIVNYCESEDGQCAAVETATHHVLKQGMKRDFPQVFLFEVVNVKGIVSHPLMEN